MHSRSQKDTSEYNPILPQCMHSTRTPPVATDTMPESKTAIGVLLSVPVTVLSPSCGELSVTTSSTSQKPRALALRKQRNLLDRNHCNPNNTIFRRLGKPRTSETAKRASALDQLRMKHPSRAHLKLDAHIELNTRQNAKSQCKAQSVHCIASPHSQPIS